MALHESLISHTAFSAQDIIYKSLNYLHHHIISLYPSQFCALSHPVAVQLADGSSKAEGRVEIFINGRWGPVCGFFSWVPLNSEIVCRQLGYSGVNRTYFGTNFGEGTGWSWLLNLHCSGSEANILQCQLDGVGLGCPHSEDVGVVCVTEDLPVEGEWMCHCVCMSA